MSFTDKGPVTGDVYGEIYEPVCGEGVPLWVVKAADDVILMMVVNDAAGGEGDCRNGCGDDG